MRKELKDNNVWGGALLRRAGLSCMPDMGPGLH